MFAHCRPSVLLLAILLASPLACHDDARTSPLVTMPPSGGHT
jgi:hypothetical protein